MGWQNFVTSMAAAGGVGGVGILSWGWKSKKSYLKTKNLAALWAMLLTCYTYRANLTIIFINSYYTLCTHLVCIKANL